MDGWTTRPGCGLALPAGRGDADRRVNASPECLAVSAEVAGFEAAHLPLLRLHQLTVDAYGAGHGGGGVPPIRLAYSLVGLHLALERSLTGDEVRAAHQRMGKPDLSWPRFLPPEFADVPTVMTVAEEGVMIGSALGHGAAVQHWAQEVWQAWADQHDGVVYLARRLLPHLTR